MGSFSMRVLAQERRRYVACALLSLLAILSACHHAQPPKPLTIQEIYRYDSTPSLRGQRVVTSAVVIYSDPLWRLLYVQDSSLCTYVKPPKNLELQTGDHVEITGTTTDTGKFLEQVEFRVTSKGDTPPPVELSSGSQFANHLSTFVRIPATVRWSGVRKGRSMIEAFAADTRFTAIVFPGASGDLPRVGSEIKIAGVTGVEQDAPGQFRGYRLLVPSSRRVEVLKAGSKDPFEFPVTPLSDLNERQKGKLVHLTGKVTNQVSSLVLSEGSRSISVSLQKALHGDFASADVVGFWTGSALEDAIGRPTGELTAHKGDIRTLSDLKHLSVAEASAHRPVSVRAVVTYIDPNWGLLFIQDQTAAAFVNISGLNLRLKQGDLVDVSGVTGPGDYAPVIQDPAVSFVGHGTLPQPLVLDPVQSNLSIADSRWTSFHGVVHSVQVVDGHTNLKLGAGEAAVNVQLPTLIDEDRFLDKEISVTGALGILFNERRQAVGHQLFVPAPEFVSIVGTGGKQNSDSTIAMLRRYSPEFDEHHSVGIRGQVVLKATPTTIFVQDATAGIQVRAVDNLKLDLGDWVVVRGYLRPGEYSPAVEDAVVSREDSGPLPEPQRVSATHADEGLHDSEYVAMTGILSAIQPTSNGVTLVLNDHGTYFDVTGPATSYLTSIRLGSELEARGIFHVLLDRSHVPYTVSGFTLAFDSPGSIRVMKAGPWWGGQRVRWALLLFAFFACAAVLWASLLRRQVHSKTEQLQLSLAAKRRDQLFDRARNEILENIARNAPLPESMERLALAIQEQIPDSVCAILMPADGKSFLNGKSAPVLIAPGLAEAGQAGHSLAAVLHETVVTDDAHIVEVNGDLIEKMLGALKSEGLPFSAGNCMPVFSPSGTVIGMLILVYKVVQPEGSESAQQNILQSASRLVSIARDHWQMHERLVHEARHDGLTGLPNRAVAEDRLEQALARAQRRKRSFAVFCIDLDGFKSVNDNFGHDAGDEVLRTVALRFRSRIRHSDTLARTGGDEFFALIDDCADDAGARAVANSLIASLMEPVSIDGKQLTLSASIGIAMYPADGQNASQLRRASDQAMYRAKSNGGGQGCFWSRDHEIDLRTSEQTSSS